MGKLVRLQGALCIALTGYNSKSFAVVTIYKPCMCSLFQGNGYPWKVFEQ